MAKQTKRAQAKEQATVEALERAAESLVPLVRAGRVFIAIDTRRELDSDGNPLDCVARCFKVAYAGTVGNEAGSVDLHLDISEDAQGVIGQLVADLAEQSRDAARRGRK